MSVIIENIFTGDGQTVLYSFSFDYIDTEDIKVTVDSVETTDWTFATTQSIQFNTAPAQDAVIRIYRSTVVTDLKARFFAGSAIRAQDLNDNFEQFLYVTQETDLIAQRANTAADAALIAADAAEDAAETAESAAQTALTNSNAAAASAAQAASDAANASSDAQQAQTDAANAVSTANAADTKATNALAAASQAQTDATNAANSAAQAQTDATNAANSASAAQTSATNAATSANQAISDAAAAQATADAALPKAGGTMTGDITFNTTQLFDGRDVSADGTKLDGIESGATGDQTGAEIKAAYEGEADTNAFTDAEKTKLAGIETGATADQTGAEIKAAYEAENDTNAFTDAEQTKLAGIEAGATADQTASEIKTLYESNNDTNAFTDAEQTKLAGIETGATADQTGAEIKAAYEGEADTNAFTDAEKTKLSGIEASADVTDATNVAAAGAVMESDTTTASMSFVVDEDDMVSNSDTKVPTQQSVKAYVDAEVAGVVDSAPGTLDTLNELAAALGDDPNFATTVTNSIATKLPLAGGTMTGNIVMSGAQTVDGRDLSVDGAKLDGIEAGATADQNASEVPYDPTTSGMTATDLQDAIDELDNRLDNSSSGGTSGPVFWSRSGTTVSPLNSGDDVSVNGDISVSGTVDGRDVSVDGAKLDGIEAGATADQTAAEIKTAYESNNDTNAFTDAEKTKLSGIAAGAEVNVDTDLGSTRTANTYTITSSTGTDVILYAANSSNSGVLTSGDKVKLDGIETGATADQTGAEIKAAYEAENNTNAFTDAEKTKLSGIAAGAQVNVATNLGKTTTTTTNVITSSTGSNVTLNEATGSAAGLMSTAHHNKLDGIAAGAEVNVKADWNASSGDAQILNKPTIPTNNNQLTNGAGYITSADGGNAALLDGIDSSQFLRSDVSDSASQRLQFTANATNNWDTIATGSGSQGCIEVYNTGSGTDAFMAFHVGSDYACYFGLDGGTNKLSVGGWSMGANSYAIYHEGNKPTLGDLGYTASTSATANTLALRDGSGDITARYAATQYVNMSHGTTTRSSDTIFYSSTDNYIRKTNATGFRSSLDVPSRSGSGATGTWGINITGSAGTLGGYGWTSSGKNVRATEFYADNWFRNYNAGEGLHNEATGCHFASDGTDQWTIRDSGNSIRLEFQTNGSARRGSVHADNAPSIGFLNSANEWGLRYLSNNGNSPNLYFLENANETWTGNPGNDEGKIEYHSNRFYIAAGANSAEVVRFRRGSTDVGHIDNSGNMTMSGNVTAYSDIRLKSDIEPITDALDKVSQINGVTFTRVDSGERQVGVIAQDVEKVLPEAVRDGEEYKSVAYGNMVGLLIEAVKELSAQVEELKKGAE